MAGLVMTTHFTVVSNAHLVIELIPTSTVEDNSVLDGWFTATDSWNSWLEYANFYVDVETPAEDTSAQLLDH